MTQLERREYNRQYRAEGFGKEADRRSYQRNREKRLAYAALNYQRHKFSQES